MKISIDKQKQKAFSLGVGSTHPQEIDRQGLGGAGVLL